MHEQIASTKDKASSPLLVEGYEHYIEDYVDCHFLHIRDICCNTGLAVSGYTCFGLSKTFDFQYWLERKGPVPCLVMIGRKSEAVIPFFDMLDIPVNKVCIDDKLRFRQTVQDCIAEQNILLAYADRYYLDYLYPGIPLSHFGLHLIAIVGIREGVLGTEYAVLDFKHKNSVWFSEDKLNLARAVHCPPFSPENQCYIVKRDLMKNLQQNGSDVIAGLIPPSVKNATSSMIEGSSNGLTALLSASKEVEALLAADINKYEKVLRFQIRMLNTFISQFDETKSFYRRAYARFLKECDSVYGYHQLREFAERMDFIANTWREFEFEGESVKEILGGIQEKLSKLFYLEQRFFNDLCKVAF